MNNKKISIITRSTWILACVLATGCSSAFRGPSQINRDGIDTIFYSENLRATYIKEHGNQDKYCAARVGDVVETAQNNLSLGLGLSNKKESASDQSGQQALSLGGRDPAVLITRELMYRACELSSNVNASQEDTIDIYKMFLNKLDQMYQQQQIQGTAASTLPMAQSQNDDSYDENEDEDDDESNDDDDSSY